MSLAGWDFVCVDLCIAGVFHGECGGAGRLHQAGFDECVGLLDVDGAPFGTWESRGESDGVAIIVDAAAHAVNPAVAQSNIERLRVGDARCAGVLLVKSDEEFAFGAVVLGEPGAEGGG